MYIPRALFSNAYAHLKAYSQSSSTSILILCALDTDSLCATRILTHLLKRDFIRHQIKPVSGYSELEKVNATLIRGNDELRFVICLGLGGLINVGEFLSLGGGVECWIFDGRRPWNLWNVFTGGLDGDETMVLERGGRVVGGEDGVGGGVGGIKCFDDGDIEEEMQTEREAFKALLEMPEVDDDDSDDDDDDEEVVEESEDEDAGGVKLGDSPGQGSSQEANGRKRKSSEELESEDESGVGRSRRRRRDSDGDDDGSSGASSPLLHTHTLLSHPSSRPLASSPPLVNGLSLRSSPPPPLPGPAQTQPQVSARSLRRKLRRLKQTHETTIASYYSQGAWYGEPISGLLYSLAADLGREDNDLLWLAIVGVCAGEIYGRSITAGRPLRAGGGWGSTTREDQIRGILRDEVRRLNPPDLTSGSGSGAGPGSGRARETGLQTTARSPSDTAIRISPEYRFMLIRHWSLYDAMLHSSYLGAKLHIWTEQGRRRLHKLLAKMGFSLSQCRQNYAHMDMDLKRSLKDKLERYAPLYSLQNVVTEGFTRCWGWRGCLSAEDVAYVVGGMLEVGSRRKGPRVGAVGVGRVGRGAAAREAVGESEEAAILQEEREVDEWVDNFWAAYDALENIETLKSALPTAMDLHRAILRTGTALIEKNEIRRLRSFRLAVVKDGPDLPVFTHPNALSKLALWIADAVLALEAGAGKNTPLVVASLNERRGVYVVVGTARGAQVEGKERMARHVRREARKRRKDARRREREERRERKRGEKDDADADRNKDTDKDILDEIDGEEKESGSESEESESELSESEDEGEQGGAEKRRRDGRNRFGVAFQAVAQSTQARVRIDSFEATVVECRKEDLAGFLEGLSQRSLAG